MAIKWTPAPEGAAKECERLFQNGGPRAYTTTDGAALRACNIGPARMIGALDVGQTIYTRRKVRATGRYEWFGYTATPAPLDLADEARKLAALVLRLNPTSGELGEGMARNLHEQARRVQEAVEQ